MRADNPTPRLFSFVTVAKTIVGTELMTTCRERERLFQVEVGYRGFHAQSEWMMLQAMVIVRYGIAKMI